MATFADIIQNEYIIISVCSHIVDHGYLLAYLYRNNDNAVKK